MSNLVQPSESFSATQLAIAAQIAAAYFSPLRLPGGGAQLSSTSQAKIALEEAKLVRDVYNVMNGEKVE